MLHFIVSCGNIQCMEEAVRMPKVFMKLMTTLASSMLLTCSLQGLWKKDSQSLPVATSKQQSLKTAENTDIQQPAELLKS